MLDPTSYTIIASLFPRFLGLIYFFAFGAFIFQIKGLIGEQGILPLKDYLFVIRHYYSKNQFYYAPTLFWLNSSDRMIMGIVILGLGLSIGLMFGFMPPLMLGLLYVLYLSIITGGQDFLSFGWEGFLLEVTAHAFLLSWSIVPNPVVWFSLNFLLFRFHFYAGAVKLQSRDPNWRNLKALTFHYQSQPLPNTIAWFMHKLPVKFHELSCAFMFFIELIVPFGIFLTDDIRLGVFVAFFSLQVLIWMSGNFAYLNHLTLVLSLILLNNSTLIYFFGLSSPLLSPSSVWLTGVQTGLGLILCILQIARGWHQLWPNSQLYKILQRVAPFHLANRYGIFAVMTTKRYEIIIEGSLDNLEWKEYTFKCKASEISRRPRRISPYQPRIDWQVWFLPFSDFESEPWFKNFLARLLRGTPCVLDLLRGNPFPDSPPKYIRVLMYDYTFSSYKEKKATGNWWHRKLVGAYTPVLTLQDEDN
jgi:lipase maturation factor 1